MLTTSEKKRILLNNIYGVDIDSQAVEVTKLSLLLKVLEGESEETIKNQLKFFRERALPDLSDNIKCGNSLIGPDFYNQTEMQFLNDEEKLRINVFDWKSEFKEIMDAGGFDVVIGNPPYIRIQAMKEWASEIMYLSNNYESAKSGNYDIYVTFVEKGFMLLRSGLLGFILPNKFFLTDYGENLRGLITKNKAVEKIIDFGSSQVFSNATTYTCLMFLSKKTIDHFYYIKTNEPRNIQNELNFTFNKSESITSEPWIIYTKDEDQIIAKLKNATINLADIPVKISRGSSTGNDKIFMLEKRGIYYYNKDNKIEIEEGFLKIPIFATDFTRFKFNPTGNKYLLFPYTITNNGYNLMTEDYIKENYPGAYNYLKNNKKELEKRKQFSQWYGYSAPRNLSEHIKSDILIPLLANRGLFTIFMGIRNNFTLMASGGFSIWVLNKEYDPNYILGLLNSKLIFWYLEKLSNDFRGGWITCTKQYVEKLPIKSKEKKFSIYNKICELVKFEMNTLKLLDLLKTPQEKTALQRQIDATDKQIDRLVYELYGLTEEEVRIVEGERV